MPPHASSYNPQAARHRFGCYVAHYRQRSRDDVSDDLLRFYPAMSAFVRTKLAAWHLAEDLAPDAAAH